MSTQAHPLTDLGFKPEQQTANHPLSDLGFKPDEQQPSGVEKFGMDISRGMGLDPEKIRRIGMDPSGEEHVGREALTIANQVLKGAGDWMTNVGHDPARITDPIHGMASALVNALGLPDVGSAFDTSAYHAPNLGQTTGALATILGGAEAPKLPGDVAGLVPGKEGVRTALQRYYNIGPELTKEAVAKRTTEVGETTAKYQKKASAIQAANEQAKADFQQRQQLTDEVQGHAKELAQRLPQLEQQVRADAKAMYPQIEGSMDSSSLVGKMQDAIDASLKGTDKLPTELGRIMKELGETETRSTGPRVGSGFMDLSDPTQMKAYQRMKAQGVFTPEESARMEGGPAGGKLDFEKLHGYYSELGEALQRDLSNDERSAVVGARKAIDVEMRRMADAEGKLQQFQDAQKNWKQYERTFNKTWNDSQGVASPIAKALRTKDPVSGEILPDRLQAMLGKDAQYSLAQKMLSRYKGAPTDVLQLMKEKGDQAAGLPKTLKQKAIPAQPELPAEVDPQQLKAQKLSELAEQMRGTGGIRGALDLTSLFHFLMSGNPSLLAYPIGRRLLGFRLQGEPAMRFLTKPTEAELSMIKPAEVYPSAKAAAKASGYKPSEKTTTMSAAPRDLGPEFKAGEYEHEIQRNKEILRNPKATAEEKAIAKSRLRDAREASQ